MPDYIYSGIRNGKVVKGRIKALNEPDATVGLSEKNIWVSSIEVRHTPFWLAKKVTRQDLLNVMYQWRAMLKSGVPIVIILERSAIDTGNKVLHDALSDISNRISRGGDTFVSALSRYDKIFDESFVNIIRKGEDSGTLVESLEYLIQHYKWADKLSKDIKRALISPIITALVMVMFTGVMFGFVMPTILGVIRHMHIELPTLTIVMIAISDFVTAYWMFILGVMFSIPPIFFALRKYYYDFRMFTDKMQFNIPIIGGIYAMIAASRFAHNMSGLYRAGVPVIEAIPLSISSIRNIYIQKQGETIISLLMKGEPMSSAFNEVNIFTPMVRQMISTGEEDGRIDTALEVVAEYYDIEVPRILESFLAVLEPALTLVSGAIMLLLMLSFFLPMYKMIGKFAGVS